MERRCTRSCITCVGPTSSSTAAWGASRSTAFRTIGASAELDTIPHRGETADTSGVIRGGNKVRLELEVPFDRSVRAIDFRSRTSLYGYYRNHVDETGSGFNLFVGAGAGYDYLEKMERSDWQWDLLANVKLGPTLDLDVYRRGVTLRAGLDVTGDFAMVKSYAYGKWRDAHPMEIVQGVLQTNPHYYYYAAGLSVAPRLAIEYGGLAAGVGFTHSRFSSLDGHDRDQEIETTHVHPRDSEQTATAWLGVQAAGAVLQLSASERRRAGQIGMTQDGSSEGTLLVSLGYAN